MQSAGIRKIYIVIRPGKWDILAYLGDGAMLKVHLAYLIMDLPFGPPYSMNQAYPFVRDSLVAFGFPDIIFQTSDAFSRLLERQASTGADMVLGLFPIDPDRSDDRVDIDMEGRVRSITLGQTKSNSQYTWNIAVWTPAFTKFIHNHLAHLPANYDINKTRKNEPIPSELTVGAVIKDAFEKGLKVEGVSFPRDSCLDIGTPHDLVRAVKLYSDI
jgi:glucose-1-phosphate thymidylyltransferase